MATGTIKPIGGIYHSKHEGSVTISANGNSDFGLSLTLPAGVYAVTVNASVYGSGNNYSYVGLMLKVGNSTIDTGATQGSTNNGNWQVPLSTTWYITLTTTTTVKPHCVSYQQPAVAFDRQSIDAIKLG